MKRRNITAWLFMLPSLAGITLFAVFPLFEMFHRSFTDALATQCVGFANYKSVVNSAAFQLASRNTLHFICVCVPLLLVASLTIAVMIRTKEFRRSCISNIFNTTVLLPMAIPVAGIVLLWRVLFAKAGLANALLISLGVSPLDFMGSDTAFYVLVFTYLWKNIGYDSLLWGTGLDSVPVDLYEASAIDGANRTQAFFFITLPNIADTAALTTLLSLLNCFKVFREAYLVAGAYPHESIYQLQHLFNNWFISLDFPRLSAAATIVLIVLFGMILAILHFIDNQGGSK